MARFTKQLRQQIVEEFSIRHNGHFNPTLFLEEVRSKGPRHPAYEWFEWDQDKAALAYQIEQARDFARDLRVSFRVEEVGRGRTVSVREAEMPMVLSPMAGRRDGGGYYLVDPENPEHAAEHCRQAAVALRAWFRRYQSALVHANGSSAAIEKAIKALEAASPSEDAEAA